MTDAELMAIPRWLLYSRACRVSDRLETVVMHEPVKMSNKSFFTDCFGGQWMIGDVMGKRYRQPYNQHYWNS